MNDCFGPYLLPIDSIGVAASLNRAFSSFRRGDCDELDSGDISSVPSESVDKSPPSKTCPT